MASRRPPNRKAMIRSAASELFLSPRVSQRLGHRRRRRARAGAVGSVSPLPQKQELLLSAVLDALERVDVLIRGAESLEEALRSLAQLVVSPGRTLAGVGAGGAPPRARSAGGDHDA